MWSVRSSALPAAALSGFARQSRRPLAGRRDELLRFLEEDRQQLRVDVVVEAAGAALDRNLLDLDRGRLHRRGRRLFLLHREGDDVARRGGTGRRQCRGEPGATATTGGSTIAGSPIGEALGDAAPPRIGITCEKSSDGGSSSGGAATGAGAALRPPVGKAKSRSPRSMPGSASAAGAGVMVSAPGSEKSSESTAGAGGAAGVAPGAAPLNRATRSAIGCGSVRASAAVSITPSASIDAAISDRTSTSAGW